MEVSSWIGVFYLLPLLFSILTGLTNIGVADFHSPLTIAYIFLIMDLVSVPEKNSNIFNLFCYRFSKYGQLPGLIFEVLTLGQAQNQFLAISCVCFSWLIAFAPMHELAHCQHKSLNRILSYGYAMISGTIRFPLTHSIHHGYTGRSKDPDSPRVYGFFFPYYVVRTYLAQTRISLKRDRVVFLAMLTVLITVHVIYNHFFGWNAELLWLKCIAFFIPVFGLLTFTTHPEEFDLPFEASMTKASRFWFLDITFHPEHHDQPKQEAFFLSQTCKVPFHGGIVFLIIRTFYKATLLLIR